MRGNADPGTARVLVLGYGNPGRGDDGLGPAFAGAVASRGWPDTTVATAGQLAIEHAADVARHEVVVFADAHVGLAEPCTLTALEPRSVAAFTTHAVDPGTVLALARALYGAGTRGWVLAIRGHRFAPFDERLSAAARADLAAALARFGRERTRWGARRAVAPAEGSRA